MVNGKYLPGAAIFSAYRFPSFTMAPFFLSLSRPNPPEK